VYEQKPINIEAELFLINTSFFLSFCFRVQQRAFIECRVMVVFMKDQSYFSIKVNFNAVFVGIDK
jgi:hypothetical protein